VPNYVVERKNKLHSVLTQLAHRPGPPPSLPELSEALGWSPQEIEEIQSALAPIVRLHESLAPDGRPLAETLADPQALNLDEAIATEQLQRCINTCLAQLPARQERILRLYFGLETGRAHSLQEIASQLGLSRERIRQLKQQALDALQEPRTRTLLAEFATSS
jgi:RNA polymerase primary sigma factor/RNA polymerase nonessential primary-like sigma factor